MSMAFCRGCGQEIDESAPACSNCGAPQDSIVKSNSIRLLNGPIWVPIASLVMGVIACLESLAANTASSDQVFIASASAMVSMTFATITLSKQANGRKMAIWGIALSTISFLIITNS